MIFGAPPLTRNDIGRFDVRERFALWPLRLHNGRYAWLERVLVVRRVGWRVPRGMFRFRPEWTPYGRFTLEQWAAHQPPELDWHPLLCSDSQ